MKQTVYKITLSSGQRCDIPAQNAGEAIEQALIKYRGQTVTRCYAGLTEEDAVFVRSTSDKKAMAGYVEHEVPAHEAISAEAVFKRARKVDTTTAMFDDAEIEAGSEMAKTKFNYGAL